MEIVEVPDILIYKEGALRSMRNQKIKKDGVLQNYGPGSGIVKDGKFYRLDSSGEIPIVIMTTGGTALSFFVISIKVDWGDGTREKYTFKPGLSLTHTYTDGAPTHRIVYYGTSTSFKQLFCDGVSLTTLDVSKNTKLNLLQCRNNLLTALDVSKNPELSSLTCSYNQLTSLDVSQNTALAGLVCSQNPLVEDQAELTKLANSLPSRVGAAAGNFKIENPVSAEWINAICAAKNWTVS